MPRLEDSLKSIVQVFVEYSDPQGNLSKDQLDKMMESEIDCAEAKGKMKGSACGQGEGGCKGNIDFNEYMKHLSCMAKCCYEKKSGKCCGK